MARGFTIPVLAYHHIWAQKENSDLEVINSPFSISKKQFHEQLYWLAQNGFRTIGMAELVRMVQTGAEAAAQLSKSIVLTFDDGWQDNYVHAFPVLHEFGFSATFFVVTSMINQKDYMSSGQLKKMHAAGMEIESHTHNHVPLELLSDGEVEWELRHSKTVLEDWLGKPVNFLSFPHGSYNYKIARMAGDAGYQACGTSDIGCVTKNSKLLRLPRFMIRRELCLQDFARLSRSERNYLFRLKLIYGAKNLLKNAVGLKNYMKLHKILYKTKPQQFEISKELTN